MRMMAWRWRACGSASRRSQTSLPSILGIMTFEEDQVGLVAAQQFEGFEAVARRGDGVALAFQDITHHIAMMGSSSTTSTLREFVFRFKFWLIHFFHEYGRFDTRQVETKDRTLARNAHSPARACPPWLRCSGGRRTGPAQTRVPGSREGWGATTLIEDFLLVSSGIPSPSSQIGTITTSWSLSLSSFFLVVDLLFGQVRQPGGDSATVLHRGRRRAWARRRAGRSTPAAGTWCRSRPTARG